MSENMVPEAALLEVSRVERLDGLKLGVWFVVEACVWVLTEPAGGRGVVRAVKIATVAPDADGSFVQREFYGVTTVEVVAVEQLSLRPVRLRSIPAFSPGEVVNG